MAAGAGADAAAPGAPAAPAGGAVALVEVLAWEVACGRRETAVIPPLPRFWRFSLGLGLFALMALLVQEVRRVDSAIAELDTYDSRITALAAQVARDSWWPEQVRGFDARYPQGWCLSCSVGDPDRTCVFWPDEARP